ncbi:amino acid adenylation domain-containing protein [Streptomyces sp. XM4011]|uniref:amino acid adenylation domain-containing protein n=1 Tax=Streptomyces TaxID=1883 RepID=UPI001FF94D78|nr:amino acid adenylation domain-containing protein [Streptomyces sp. XM4011]MCK1813213.1 amino acid adenylation domain-containing protein [Streptomyces sp. XM4011]
MTGGGDRGTDGTAGPEGAVDPDLVRAQWRTFGAPAPPGGPPADAVVRVAPEAVRTLAALTGGPERAAETWGALWAVLTARLTGAEATVLAVRTPGAGERPVPLTVPVAPGESLATVAGAVRAAWPGGPGAGPEGQEPLPFHLTPPGGEAPVGDIPWAVNLMLPRSGPARLTAGEPGAAALLSELALSLERLVMAAAADPHGPADGLLCVTERQAAVLSRPLNPAPPHGAASVPELFVRTAARLPERTAVAGADRTLTYRALEERSARVAARLRAAGAGPGRGPVAVVMDRGADLVTVLLGVLRSGAPYVPLDPAQPPERLRHLLADCGATLAVADRALAPWPGRVLSASDALRRDPPDTPLPAVGPRDPAYLLYTSGSTGPPKAVTVSHGALAAYARGAAEVIDPTGAAHPCCATVTGFATDLGNTAVFPPLVTGGRVQVVPTEVAMDPEAFAAYGTAAGIDVLKITPSLLAALLDEPDPAVLPRRLLVLGGEPLPWHMVERVRALGGCRIVNHYGPTETTVGALTYEVGSGPEWHRRRATVPIGRPLSQVTAHVVDRHLRPVPPGGVGELLIGGPQVADGYHNAPEETARRFVPDPVDPAHGTVFRTGDLVRLLADGSVEFVSRLDRQLKLRGHRVSPQEVEWALHGHPEVRRAVVLAEPAGPGGPRLAAHVVPVAAGAPPAGLDTRLLAHLRGRLPAHLVPAVLHVVERLPLTGGGKLDTRSLSGTPPRTSRIPDPSRSEGGRT